MSAAPNSTPQSLWRALYYFNLYRLCIGVGFFALAMGRSDFANLGERAPQTFTAASFAMVAMAVLNLVTITRGQPDFRSQAHLQFTMDALLITVAAYASGGISSGVSLLLVISVAAGGVVLSGRMSLFFAALATLLTFSEHSFSRYLYSNVSGTYVQVAMLGVALFGTGLLVHLAASRIRRAEALAERSVADLAALAKLNEIVVERLETGVVVTGPDGILKLINNRARELLDMDTGDAGIRLPTALTTLLSGNAPIEQPVRIKRSSGSVAVRLQHISGGDNSDIVVFLEDLTQTEQRAQQLKLAALGRLTAAVAHEIRNPLGAISHAGQLIAETPDLATEQRKLVGIITRHSERINQIVTAILELGRPGHTELTELPLGDWLADFCQSFAESRGADAPELVNLADSNLTVCTNPAHLHQVLTNLCENALRHSPTTHSVRPPVRLESGVHGTSDTPYLDVFNSGPIIREEIRDKMFEPFFSTDGKGLGLGLYLSRELCQNSYGRLEYVPDEHGNRFRIYFAPAGLCRPDNEKTA